MEYSELLANAPAHDSLEFIDYLCANNVVVEKTKNWILIENYKYHSAERPWLTLFAIRSVDDVSYDEMRHFLEEFFDWTWLKKSAEEQTVQRFHIHLVKGKI